MKIKCSKDLFLNKSECVCSASIPTIAPSSPRSVGMRGIGAMAFALYPALRRCGMTERKKAFTLIELLVVVLIIGILAAVALPQYNKAVMKARLVKAVSFVNAAEKALQAYVLQNGYSMQSFTGSNASAQLDIDLLQSLDCSDSFSCKDGNFYYWVTLEEGYYSILIAHTDNDSWAPPEDSFTVTGYENGRKTYECNYLSDSPKAKRMCELIPQLIPGAWTIREM